VKLIYFSVCSLIKPSKNSNNFLNIENDSKEEIAEILSLNQHQNISVSPQTPIP